MYRIAETGHTVSITKEKFLNTYPPLFNTLFVGFVQRTGCFFVSLEITEKPFLTGKPRILTQISLQRNGSCRSIIYF